MPLTIPDDLLAAAHLSEEEALQELAIALFQQERLTSGKAAQLARMTKPAFHELLRKRNIPLYRPTIEDFEQDLATLRKLERV
jgi:predicted HTH domain antitoxin